MSCCGSRRALAGFAGRSQAATTYYSTGVRSFIRNSGAGALTINGAVSGLTYRFRPGAIVEVDPRDAEGLTSVPQLHLV
jgi:hypothetical protein